MPAYWFDVFTAETWEEARAHGFAVSGFSESKYGTVKRVKPGDILICYLKGAKQLIGALQVVGEPYFAREPRIWAGADFPARVGVEPVVTLPVDAGIDFLALLPRMGVHDPSNMRSTWARFQGSPTLLSQADGELLLSALDAAQKTSAPARVTPPPAPKQRTAQARSKVATPQLMPDATSGTMRLLADPLDALIAELTTAQRDASHPARFEQAVADVFAFLGLDAKRFGQPNNTDVVVNSLLGHDRFRAIVDAKASSSGKVPEGQINWAAVSGHRQQAGADYAAIVGERFAGGNLQKFAAEYNISLIATEELVEILRLYARSPLPAADLRPLFATAGPVSAVVADLRQKGQAAERHWRLVAEIVRLVVDFSRLDPPLILTTGNLHAVLVSRALARGAETFSPPAEQDVRDAVAFLASRAVGVLRPLDPETSGYRLAMSEHTALQRLRAVESTVHALLSREDAENGRRQSGEASGMPLTR